MRPGFSTDPTDKIPDPGNARPIQLQQSGFIEIVTAGSETRALGRPRFPNQQLTLYMRTDGGDCVISVTGGINQTGNNTITMNDAGDTIVLFGIRSGTNLVWRTAVNDGCSLTTA